MTEDLFYGVREISIHDYLVCEVLPSSRRVGYDPDNEKRCYYFSGEYIIFKTEYGKYHLTTFAYEYYLKDTGYEFRGNFPYPVEISDKTVGWDKMTRLMDIEVFYKSR